MFSRCVTLVWISIIGISGSTCRIRADHSHGPGLDQSSVNESKPPTHTVKKQEPPEAVSWLGQALFAPKLEESTRDPFESQLELARRRADENPNEALSHIWFGRRLAYLGRFNEAIEVYTKAIERFPNDARLYRHRGHRYLTTRKLHQARQDFLKAAKLVTGKKDEIEPDGLPNAQNKPRSTLQGNIYYHLGLIDFLFADFSEAETHFRRALDLAKNDDSRVAVLHWLHLILRRQNRHKESQTILSDIKPEMDIIENDAYHRLLQFYQGKLSREALVDPSQAGGWKNPAIIFGLAYTLLLNREQNLAYDQMQELVKESRWDAFGTIAAEAELARRNPLVSDDHRPFDLQSHLTAWTEIWRTYDLNSVRDLFLPSARLTYYSSEKPGRMQGIAAILEHHRSFGFIEGGKATTKELWVDNSHAESFGGTVIVTGTWYFGNRSASALGGRSGTAKNKPQQGPFTFVYVHTSNGYRIAHAHFAND